MHRILLILIAIAILPLSAFAAGVLIPMDETQTNHLKAYGVVYKSLEKGYKSGADPWHEGFQGYDPDFPCR